MIIFDKAFNQENHIAKETAVLLQAKKGDSDAWTELMTLHQEAAFRLAYLLIGNLAEAEDVTQEAFIRAYTHLNKMDTKRPFRPWLLRIVRNLAYNQHRGVKRYLAMVTRFFQQVDTNDSNHLTAQLDKKNEATALRQAVQALKPRAREVIYLRYFLELSEQETAETLNIPKGTVKSRTNRALKALRPIIEQDYPHLKELL